MKTLFLSFLILACLPVARGNEYDDRLREKFEHERTDSREERLRQLAEWSVNARDQIAAYLGRNGGNAGGVTCSVANNYTCVAQGACYLYGRSTVALQELGAFGDSFRSCDFRLSGDRSCRVESPDCMRRHWAEKKKKNCTRASLQVSCIDGARRTSGEYLYGAYTGGDTVPARKAPRSRR